MGSIQVCILRKEIMTKKDYKAKEIFDMVYQWGRLGIVVDFTAPAYQEAIEELLKEKHE